MPATTHRALLVLVAAATLVAPLPALAQKADLKAEALRDLNEMKSTMVKIASAMPEDKFGYRATPPQRTFGEQIQHITDANMVWTKTLGAKATAPAVNKKPTSKAETIRGLEASIDSAAAAIGEQTADSMLEQVTMPWSKELESRLHVVYSIISHAWDIYGQMAVYLRLNGLVPPASQRP